MTYEDRVRAAIQTMADDALRNIAAAGSVTQQQVSDYVRQVLKDLSLDLPLSVKDILDKGGAVRQIEIFQPFSTHLEIRFNDRSGAFYSFPELYAPVDTGKQEERTAQKYRVLIIIEPIP